MPGPVDVNRLYYGDNLDVLRRHVKDESVDLVYLDPPFNSNATYNALFGERDGTRSAAQVTAFEDTWQWDTVAAATYQDCVERGGRVADALMAFRTLLGPSNTLAYLSMMAPRLVELRRVLKPTGSLYLHCDPTASHYLKLILDAIFDVKNYRNEITWKRRVGMSSAVHDSNRFGTITDTIFLYARSDASTFHPQYNKDDPEYQRYIRERFTLVDDDGRRYQATSLTNPAPRPNLIYEYKGYQPPANGWMISRTKMEQWDREGRIHFPKEKTQRLRRKSYADELQGMPIQNLWLDIQEINSQAAERLGYPTQKPVALLERIIAASSNPGDVVLDPFCGCGTAVDAAQKLGRRWIGIDITHLSVNLIKHRLLTAYGTDVRFTVIGEPTDVASAQQLAREDPYQFQFWALGLLGARPVEEKKGADKGIDGRLLFHDEQNGPTKQILFSVKAGKNIHRSMVHELRGVIEREGAAMGVLITMEPPTKPMREDAASAGFYEGPFASRHPRLQLITVGELLDGRQLDTPGTLAKNVTLKRSPKAPGRQSRTNQPGATGAEPLF